MINKAKQILSNNSYSKFTVPNKKLYPFQWNWDSLITALGISTYNLDRSLIEIETLFESQWLNGMIPHIIFHKYNEDYFPGESEWTSNTEIPTSCITQPPISGTILWFIYNNNINELNNHKDRIIDLCNKIFKNLKWFEEYRDLDNKGLISTIHPWESGRDNSIEWDEPLKNMKVSHNLKKYCRKDLKQIADDERPTKEDYDKYITIVEFGENCKWDKEEMYYNSPFNVIDIGIQFMYIKSLKDLLKIYENLNYHLNIIELKNMIEKYQNGINLLWNEEIKCYSSLNYKNNKLINEITHASFMYFYAEINNRNVDKYILENFNKYIENSKYIVPSISINHDKFNSKKYWRGPIWCIINFFLYIGFIKVNKEISESIKNNTIQLIENDDFCEYFDPLKGKGCGCNNFSWSASIYILLKNNYNLSD